MAFPEQLEVRSSLEQRDGVFEANYLQLEVRQGNARGTCLLLISVHVYPERFACPLGVLKGAMGGVRGGDLKADPFIAAAY